MQSIPAEESSQIRAYALFTSKDLEGRVFLPGKEKILREEGKQLHVQKTERADGVLGTPAEASTT